MSIKICVISGMGGTMSTPRAKEWRKARSNVEKAKKLLAPYQIPDVHPDNYIPPSQLLIDEWERLLKKL